MSERSEPRSERSELQKTLREHLEQLKATGMPLPDDLVELDRRLTENVEGAAPDETD